MSDSDSSEFKLDDSNCSDGSSSSSSFDDLQKAFMAERKRMRRNRVSADGMAILETSSSEDSSPPRIRRRTALPLSDSDVISSSSEEDEEEPLDESHGQSSEPAEPKINEQGTSKASADVPKIQQEISDSDSGGESTDKCPICLRGIRLQEVGSPEGCDHNFCFTCLEKWSQNCNRCPLDRQPFSIILVRDNLNGQVVRQIQVTKCDLDMSYDFMDTVFCQVCRGYNNEEAMLLCDRCDRGYHLECLTPPLAEIPYGSWFCPHCVNLPSLQGPMDINLPELLRATYSRLTRPPLTRSSRVDWEGFFLMPGHSPASPLQDQTQPQSTQTIPSTTRASSSRKTTTTRKKKRKTKRKKPKTVQRNTVLVEGANGEVTEETVVVKKCVYRRKKKKKTKKTVKKRTKPSGGSSSSIIPALRRHFLRSLGTPLVSAVSRGRTHTSRTHSNAPVSRITSLSLFEDRYQLAPVSSDSEMEGFDGEVATVTRRRVNLSTRPLERSKAIELYQRPAPPRPIPQPCQDRADLLSSILESQSFWHSKNSSATIKSDGKVEVKPKNNAVDVRNAGVERTSTAAPVFPESQSHSGSLRTTTENFSNVSEPGPSGSTGDSIGPSSSRVNAPVNDREGYRNFFNNIPLGPTPICRTGAPLRFRMPVRPQLRRIPLLPRRPARTAGGNDDDEETPDGDKKKDEKHSEEEPGLYSDVELKEGEITDGEAVMGIAPAQEEPNNDPDAYDPADPCDSDEEVAKTPVGSPAKVSNDDECPVFSLYSSDSVAFSRKDEEERANLAEQMTQHESVPSSSTKLSFNLDASQTDSGYSMDGKSKREASVSPEAPRRRRSSSSSQSSSPGTPRRIRNLPKKEDDASSFHRTYRKRGGSASSEREVRKTDDEKLPNEPSRVSTGLEGLDVEAVSSGNELEDDRLSSLSLSGVSSQSRHSSPVAEKKRRRKKSPRDRSRSRRCASEEGEINSDKDNRKKRGDENKSDSDKKRRDRSKSVSPSRQILGSKENKKELSWKKPSRGDKKFRNSRKTTKEKDRKRKRNSASPSPKRDKRKSKDKKKGDKKKEIERYDVRKVVKVKQVEKKDEFGRDVKSRSLSSSSEKSRSRSRNRNAARRSRSHSRRARRRGRFRSNSPSNSRKRPKSSEKDGRKTRRSRSKKRSASPRPRVDKKTHRSWSRSSLSSPTHSPVRKRRTVTPPRRRHSNSWSPAREPALQNLTVVVKPKDKKKKKNSRSDKTKHESKKKKAGNLKEVFASGDNVLVSVNFKKSSKSNNSNVLPLVTPVRLVTKRRKRSAERTEKPVKPSAVPKTVVDAALSTQPPKRKKLLRLNDEDAEKILNQKPVAVIDLDESPYREQTPSPINVVVVSDSGSGDEAQLPVQQGSRVDDNAKGPSSSPVGPVAISGPKTPPEPPLKFSIAKASLIRPMVNPLADEEEEIEEEPAVVTEGQKEKIVEVPQEPQQHKGPNTPLSTPPRGPSTPKTPLSPQSSLDAYDPFKPTQSPTSNTASDHHVVKESPIAVEPAVEIPPITSTNDEPVKPDASEEAKNEIIEIVDLTEHAQPVTSTTTESIDVVISQQSKKTTPQPVTSNTVPAMSLLPLRSPSKTPNRAQCVTTAVGVSGIQRLQHRLGSPVNKTPNSVKSTPEKRAPELSSEKIHNVIKRNGPLQDTTNEPIDMDDSPYSPATSEGDDLFEPPPPPPPPPGLSFKPPKPAAKPANKFDLLFGTGNTSPIRNGSKKAHKAAKHTKPSPLKPAYHKKTPTKKTIPAKMDEDQLRILDEVPSSAVELQVKDKFLKKLNRQERVVDEVKTVLKPFYAAKRISKEEYKDILRRAVPKICHSKSGEINPSKIKHLVEAYVRKCPQKKPSGPPKPKLKKMMFS